MYKSDIRIGRRLGRRSERVPLKTDERTSLEGRRVLGGDKKVGDVLVVRPVRCLFG